MSDSIIISKFISQVNLQNQVPCSHFMHSTEFYLTWNVDCPSPAYFELYQGGNSTPIYKGNNNSFKVSEGLTVDTSFVLKVTSNDDVKYETLTVTIEQPLLTPSQVEISGNQLPLLKVNGPSNLGNVIIKESLNLHQATANVFGKSVVLKSGKNFTDVAFKSLTDGYLYAYFSFKEFDSRDPNEVNTSLSGESRCTAGLYIVDESINSNNVAGLTGKNSYVSVQAADYKFVITGGVRANGRGSYYLGGNGLETYGNTFCIPISRYTTFYLMAYSEGLNPTPVIFRWMPFGNGENGKTIESVDIP